MQPQNPSSETVWTFGRLREWTEQYLAKKGIEQAGLETQVLMSHALQCSRIELFTQQEREATQEGRDRLRELIQKRAEGAPVAYLVGQKEFFSLSFEVDESVLIPRPDSEWIVYECLQLAKEMDAPTILDLGTGSGCLAIALAHQNKNAKVTAVDISELALKLAHRNAEKQNVDERVTFVQSDLFDALEDEQQFDFVISNPPYIRTADLETLQKEVRDFEPRLALDGGDDGFQVFDRIIAQAPRHLRPGGHLILEIGADQEIEARERIENVKAYQLAKTIHDANGLARVLHAKLTKGEA